MKYDLLAIDLDGTLLDPWGRVSERNLAALKLARASGVRIAVCTGRGLVECRHVLEQIGQVDPVVVAGGAIVADPVSGGTVHRFAIDLPLVERTVGRLLEHRHPALVLKDPVRAGYDYLVVRGRDRLPLDPVTEWWFESMNVRVRDARGLEEDDHPEHTVRVGACGPADVMEGVKADLAGLCGDRACMHSFGAAVAPEHASRAGGQELHVLELFDIGANKWSAVNVLAKKLGVRTDRIAAIGDEVNDESMIRHAALGVAMGNAVPVIKAAAQRHTLSNREDGVAFAVEKIVAGEW